eukprot:6202981-Pleurochrysis_carterae.AAC.5
MESMEFARSSFLAPGCAIKVSALEGTLRCTVAVKAGPEAGRMYRATTANRLQGRAGIGT